MGGKVRGGVSCRWIGAALLRADGARTDVARSSLRRFVGIAFVFRVDGGADLFGIGIGASRKICRTIRFAIRDYSIFDFAYTRCVAASDAGARNDFCSAYYAEHSGVFGVRAGCCFKRDISFAESVAAPKKTGWHILAISGAGCFGEDE